MAAHYRFQWRVSILCRLWETRQCVTLEALDLNAQPWRRAATCSTCKFLSLQSISMCINLNYLHRTGRSWSQHFARQGTQWFAPVCRDNWWLIETVWRRCTSYTDRAYHGILKNHVLLNLLWRLQQSRQVLCQLQSHYDVFCKLWSCPIRKFLQPVWLWTWCISYSQRRSACHHWSTFTELITLTAP